MPDPGVQLDQRLAQLKPYRPGVTEEQISRTYNIAIANIIKLGSNENPYGMSPKAAQAIQKAAGSAHRYPDSHALLDALSNHLGASANQLVLGVGSTEVIDMIARAFLSPDTETIVSEYAFAMLAAMSHLSGASVISTPAKDYAHDPDAMLQAVTDRTRVIWLANPNNPTGTYLPPAQIQAFLEKVPAHIIVVIDEAYKEYLAPEDHQRSTLWLQTYPNLILLGTFSKVYGLAGLRIGYGVTNPKIAAILNSVKQPLNISTVGLAAAVAALQDQAYVQQARQRNHDGLQQLINGLKDLHLTTLPAYGNFVTVELPNAADTNEALLKQGIVVRPLTAYNMPNHLRITVGTPNENQELLKALQQIPA